MGGKGSKQKLISQVQVVVGMPNIVSVSDSFSLFCILLIIEGDHQKGRRLFVDVDHFIDDVDQLLLVFIDFSVLIYRFVVEVLVVVVVVTSRSSRSGIVV